MLKLFNKTFFLTFLAEASMIQETLVKLSTNRILNVPFQTYEKDFTLIVNGTEFEISRLNAMVSKMHEIDATFSQYTINTLNSGNFNIFLILLFFSNNQQPMFNYSLENSVKKLLIIHLKIYLKIFF